MSSKLNELIKGMEHADLSALKTDSLPPVPEHVQNALTNIGGTVPNSDKPLFRIVSGLDPKITEFAYGEWHRKYVSARDLVREIKIVKVINKRTKQERLLSVQDAFKEGIIDDKGVATAYGKGTFNMVFTTSDTLIEYGIPRYIVERFRSPEEFGSPEEWEEARYLKASDPLNNTGKDIDALGEYPHEGRYEEFCKIEDGLEDPFTGEIVSTTYKPITEAVVEQIADMILISKQPPVETLKQIIEKADGKKAKEEAEFDDRIEQGIKENQGRITNMPQIGYGGSARTTNG